MVLAYVVTGASRGLGLEFVKQIADKGHVVFACARNPDSSKDLHGLIDYKHNFGVKVEYHMWKVECLPVLLKRVQDKAKKILNMSSMLGSIANIESGGGLSYESAYCLQDCCQ
jgi:NAD(P)-dependent dehydrogenase (short-subunit alcohol dehydrogenase family)